MAGIHRRMSGRWLERVISWGLVLVVGLGWWVTLAPTTLGGPVSHVIVSGHSMEPLLHTGDLVLTHRERAYQVGDLVVVTVDGGQVIHRLHDGNAVTGWHTKGDNRKDVDTWVVHPKDIVGKQWIILRGFQTRLAFLWSPWARPAGAAVVAFLVLLFPLRRRRRDHRLAAALVTRVPTPKRRGRPALETVGFALTSFCTIVSTFFLLLSLRTGAPWVTQAAATALLGSAATALGLRLFRGVRLPEPRRTFAVLGSRVVDVRNVPVGVATRVAASAVELAKVADRERVPVVHVEERGAHRFVVLGPRNDTEWIVPVRVPETVEDCVGDDARTYADDDADDAGIALIGGRSSSVMSASTSR